MAVSSNRERLRQALADLPTAATSDPSPDLPGPRRAAIAVILLELGSSLEVLLIERAERSGDPWSGHMALPGGHAAPEDSDLRATAERETLEEVGLDLREQAEQLGHLSDRSPAQGMTIGVRPFVYLLRVRPTLTVSEEVRQAMWVDVAPLQRGERGTTVRFGRSGQEREFPAWDIDGHIVWGLTYRVLDEFFRRFNHVSAPA